MPRHPGAFATPSSADPTPERLMKPATALSYLLLAAGCSLLAGCKTQAELNREEVQRISAAHDRYMQQMEMIRADFQRENPMPLKLDFGTEGTLVLRECQIAGLPGHEKLRLKFTFLNATGITLNQTTVTLTLIDRVNELEWSEIMDVSLPYNLKLGHNSSYSSFFEMPLEGLHLRGDWDWRIELESDREAFPGSQG